MDEMLNVASNRNEYKLNNEADKKLMKSTGLQSNSTSSPSVATYSC